MRRWTGGREYRKIKNEVKRLIKEAKSRKDEELGRKLSRDFVSNRKLYHREIKSQRWSKE